MASKTPAQCCVVNFKHDGEPQGHMGKIGDIPAYFAYPKSGENVPTDSLDTAMIFLVDILGLPFVNSKLQADLFAESLNCSVVMPDILEGDPIQADAYEKGHVDLHAWLANHTPERIDPIVERTIHYLREEKKVKKIGAIGYCFGGKYVTRFLDAKRSLTVDVGYAAHPSLVTHEELAAVRKPYSISAAETDAVFTKQLRWESEDILSKTGQPWQITLYSGVVHGFALKGELATRHQNWCKEQAFAQAVAWFTEHL